MAADVSAETEQGLTAGLRPVDGRCAGRTSRPPTAYPVGGRPFVVPLRYRHVLIYALGVGNVLTAAIYALAVARVTRLVTEDKILETPRNALLKRLKLESHLAYLLTCRWCASVWLAIPAAVVWYFWDDNPWLLIPAAALAFSYITGWAATHEES